MTEVELTRLLTELRQTAKDLNQESNSINDIISRFEVVLREVNLGIEVWLTSDPIASEHWSQENDAGTPEEGDQDEELGFVKRDTWRLAVRTAIYRQSSSAVGGCELVDVASVVNLSETSRDTRIEALKRFPLLAKKMNDEAQAALRAIEGAKKMVK